VASDKWIPTYDALAEAPIVATPAMPRPEYLQPAVDPAFGTRFTRITDPGRKLRGMTCAGAYCTHRYSISQAWNADESLMVIANGCGGLCFIDGYTYEPLFQRKVPNECEWHPIDPTRMICMRANTIYIWEPRNDVETVVYRGPDQARFEFGPYKGNPSDDGRRVVVRVTNGAGALAAFAYDILSTTKFPDIDLGDLPGKNGFCGISPSGRYILCQQKLSDDFDVAYVFTVNGVRLQSWTEHHRPGHGDMAIDADGRDVYVGISKSEPDKYHIIKRRLDDGTITDLAPYGAGQHASMRNTRRPGWVFVTYSGGYSDVATHPSWAPFYQEVIALRTDGSGRLRRIVHTRDAKHDYWSEAHASPSPDGSQVVWSSNWGEPGGPVADYVAQLAWPDTTTTKLRLGR
jgi:hypothetical protein